MPATSILRIAALSAILAFPLASAAVAFAGDDDSPLTAKHQSATPPCDPDPYCGTVATTTHPWMMRSDD